MRPSSAWRRSRRAAPRCWAASCAAWWTCASRCARQASAWPRARRAAPRCLVDLPLKVWVPAAARASAPACRRPALLAPGSRLRSPKEECLCHDALGQTCLPECWTPARLLRRACQTRTPRCGGRPARRWARCACRLIVELQSLSAEPLRACCAGPVRPARQGVVGGLPGAGPDVHAD